MPRPTIEKLSVTNYGCIKNATFQLSPIHALIGPNDSGKSTVLRCLRTLSLLASKSQVLGNAEGGLLLDQLKANTLAGHEVIFSVSSAGKTWEAKSSGKRGVETLSDRSSGVVGNGEFMFGGGSNLIDKAEAKFRDAVEGSLVLRLEPDALREPSGLIQDGQPLGFKNERGAGLPAVYDAILARDFRAYTSLNDELKKLFPAVDRLSLRNIENNKKALGVTLKDGTNVSAEFMSEGLLYALAFLALPYMERTALLLIEEPENGLHPARVAEVMSVLRNESARRQVVIATHSPLVVNELQPEEVSVLTRTEEEGTRVVLMKNTANFEERSKVYALGELWVSYANGEDEAPLLKGEPRP